MLSSLTSLRFIAAMMVFVWHTHILSSLLDKYQLGYVGVGFFYILSGFILTYVYFEKLKTINIKSIKKFYIARIAKLYPVHILIFCLLFLPVVLSILGNVFSQGSLDIFKVAAANLFLLQSWSPDPGVHFSFNGVAWSISVELFFYACFPLIIFLIARYKMHLSVKRLFLAMLVMWVVVAALYSSQYAALDEWKFYILPIARLPDFIMGVLLAAIFLKVGKRWSSHKLMSPVNMTRIEVISILLVVASICISPLLPQSLRFGVWMMPAICLMIIVFAYQSGRFSKILSFKPLIFLGNISFSFYMVHLILINYVTGFGLSHTAVFFVSLALAIAVSSLLYIYFEEPSRIRLKQFLEKRLVA